MSAQLILALITVFAAGVAEVRGDLVYLLDVIDGAHRDGGDDV